MTGSAGDRKGPVLEGDVSDIDREAAKSFSHSTHSLHSQMPHSWDLSTKQPNSVATSPSIPYACPCVTLLLLPFRCGVCISNPLKLDWLLYNKEYVWSLSWVLGTDLLKPLESPE